MSDCLSKFNFFCYVCGKFTIMTSRRKFTCEVAQIYEQYFNIPVIRSVQWTPAIACTTCVNQLQKWSKGVIESMPFGIPMLWSDPGEHVPDQCYVCVNNIKGLNRRKARQHEYKGVPSVQLPLPHSENVPVPKRPSPTEQYVAPTFDTVPESSYSLYQPPDLLPSCGHIEITQNRLDLIVRQLKLSQNKQIVLTQHLKAVNILAPGVRVYDARGRQREFLKYFDRSDDNSFAYCNDIPGLMRAMGHHYKPEEWRLFIDSSKASLKAVLLYVDNSKSSVPVALSTKTKENYESMKKILDAIKYNEYLWKICADLKVISLLCGLQLGYTKNMCYICQWDTRYKGNQYQKHDWPLRQTARIGQHNVVNVPLVPIEKVLLPPLHIKLGLVKNFIKALVARNNDTAFEHLEGIFPRLSKKKIKEGKHFLSIHFLFFQK